MASSCGSIIKCQYHILWRFWERCRGEQSFGYLEHSKYLWEAIASLIPIYLHLQKLCGKLQLRAHALPNNYILCSLLELRLNIPSTLHHLSLEFLTKCQYKLIKGPVVDMDNRFNEVFSAFDPLNPEFTPGCRVNDSFSSRFSFHSFNRWNKKSLFSHSHQLDTLCCSNHSPEWHS